MEIGLIVLATHARRPARMAAQAVIQHAAVGRRGGCMRRRYQAPFNAKPKLVALTTFLAVVTSFFRPDFERVFLAHGTGRLDSADRAATVVGQHGVLVLASVVFQWTRNACLLAAHVAGQSRDCC